MTKAAIDRLIALSELAEPIIKGYWPEVGPNPEQNYLARSEGGVSSRALPLTKAQVDYLYELDEWFRANLSALSLESVRSEAIGECERYLHQTETVSICGLHKKDKD